MNHLLALVVAIVILAFVIYGVLYGCLWLASRSNRSEHDQ